MASNVTSSTTLADQAADSPAAWPAALLRGHRVVLRAPQEEDLPLLIELRNDVELQTLLMSVARPNSRARVLEWLAQRSSDSTGVFMIIGDRVNGAALGFIQAQRMDFIHGHAWLGICLASGARGRGAGGESLQLLEQYLIDSLRIRKLMLEVLATNVRAIEFYRRSGYQTVGTWRQHFYAQGQYQDVQVMEKLLEPRRGDRVAEKCGAALPVDSHDDGRSFAMSRNASRFAPRLPLAEATTLHRADWPHEKGDDS